MLPRCLLAVSLAVIGLPLFGQDDGPIKMTPDLALAIPLLQKGHDVTVKFPVLINRTTVLRPGMVLRNIYLPPNHEVSENLNAAHMGNMAESFSRDTSMSPDAARMSSNDAHEIERQRRVIWEVPVNFQLALAQLPTDDVHLIFSTSGRDLTRDLDDEGFTFFDGLFLGSPSGGVTVLAVETGSKADQAGFKPGDQLLAVSGKTVGADLGAFPALWSATRQLAKDGNATSIPFMVRSQGASGNHTVSLGMPPTIKSQLMQGF